MTRHQRIGMLSLCASLLALGCGDSDGDTLPDSAELTRSAYDKACESAEDFLIDQYGGNYFVQAFCTANAVENNTDAEACGDDLAACLNNPPASVQSGIDALLGQAGCSAIAVDPSACSSTVGRLRDCLDALDAELSSVQYTLTCAAAGETLSGWDVVDWPTACDALTAECGQ